MCLRGRLVGLAVALLLASPAFAQDSAPSREPEQRGPLREKLGSTDFTLSADEVLYDRNSDVYEARGSVRVEQSDGRTLSTDWLVFNGTTRVGIASGAIRLTDIGDTMTAEFMAVDLSSMVALATEATLDTPSPGFTVRGKALERSGVNKYRVEEATFTTCRCPGGAKPTPWELEIEDARVELGGYAVGKNLVFKILDVPVLYLPWLAFPAKSERQTGFLMPSFSLSGRNGAEVETPFFLAVNDRVNATLRPAWISKRGFKAATDLEYLFGERGWGDGGLAVLPGDEEVNDEDFETPFSDNRWAYWWRHQHPLGRSSQIGIDLARFSDNQYVVDFDELADRFRNSRFAESKAWASYAKSGTYASIQASLVDDLQSPTDLDRDDFFLQKLPDLRFSRLPMPTAWLPFQVGFDTRYTYFHRIDGRKDIAGTRSLRDQFFDTGRDGLFDSGEPAADGTFPGTDVHTDNFGGVGRDSSEGDGIYQEGELLANRGHRLDVYPHVTLPQRLGILESLTEVGYRETLYFPDAGGTERREIWTGRFDLRTRLAKSMTLRDLPLRHLVEPRATFVGVSVPSQGGNPLFLPASTLRAQRLIDGDARLLSRDPTDRVEDERILQLQVGNRFYGPSRDGGTEPNLLAEIRVGSGYDFIRDTATRIFANGLVRPIANVELGFDAGWDPDAKRVDEASASLLWESPRGHLLDLSYRYLRDRVLTFENFVRQDEIFDEFDDGTKISQLGLNSVAVVNRNLQFFAEGFWALNSSSSSAGSAGIVIGSDCRCWDILAMIEHRTRPGETRFKIELNLAGIGRRSERDRRSFRRR